MQDTKPDEEKSLIEEKLKKVKTEKAPVAGQQSGSGSGQDLSARQQQNLIQQALRAGAGGDLRSLNELNELLGQRRGGGDFEGAGSGAAAAAGVLTAVDEDGEDDDEAQMPDEFEYFSDAAGDDEDDD